MNITEVKNLMAQFDASSLREFSYKTADGELAFSKNEQSLVTAPTVAPQVMSAPQVTEVTEVSAPTLADEEVTSTVAEGDLVESPLVGVAYLSPAPDKPAFVTVGDSVKKGQTLLIIEAMKVMNEVPATKDGIVTEILVANEDVIEFGQGLVRIK